MKSIVFLFFFIASCASTTSPSVDNPQPATKGYLGVWHESQNSMHNGVAKGDLPEGLLTLNFIDSVDCIITDGRGSSWRPSSFEKNGTYPTALIKMEWGNSEKDYLWLQLNVAQDSLLAFGSQIHISCATAFNR